MKSNEMEAQITTQSLAYSQLATVYDEPIMARALGGLDGKRLLNVPAALENALANGFKVFEVDVRRTRDGVLCCAYGWDEEACKRFGLDFDPENGPMTGELFKQQKIMGYEVMTAERLYEYMKANPDTWWVIDFGKLSKEYTSLTTRTLLETFRADRSVLDRCLIQIRNTTMFRGVENVYHFPHYQMQLWPKSRIEYLARLTIYCNEKHVEGLSIDQSQCTPEVIETVRKGGVRVSAFGVEDAERANELLKMGVNTICSSFLTPADITPVEDPYAGLTEEECWNHLNDLRESVGKARRSQRKTAVSDEVVVEFKNVSKTYNLYKNDRQRLLHLLLGKKNDDSVQVVNANNDLSFQIRRGEGVAFLGHNGAGKSTALKMITGVSFPTSGEVVVNGEVSALLELRAGFNRNLTGRENIYLRGHALGMTEKEIAELEPKVLEFAELGHYIDQPLRNYSSGMKARLGFAFAVSTDPDILVVDEALSVGDKKFKQKCMKRIREIMDGEDVTVLFVTHSSGAAQEFCSRGIVLDHGTKIFDGTITDAIAFYERHLGVAMKDVETDGAGGDEADD